MPEVGVDHLGGSVSSVDRAVVRMGRVAARCCSVSPVERWRRPVVGLVGLGVVLVAVLADLEVGPVDGVAVLVDDLDPLEEPVERLALAHIGAYSRQLATAFELGPHPVDRLADPLGDLGQLLVEVLVGALDAPRPRPRPAAPGRPWRTVSAASAQLGGEVLGRSCR